MSLEHEAPLTNIATHEHEPGVDEFFAASTSRLEALEEMAVAGNDIRNELIDCKASWQKVMKEALAQDSENIKYVSRFFELQTKRAELDQRYGDSFLTEDTMEMLIYQVGENIVASAFAAEKDDGPLHRAIMDAITLAVEPQPDSEFTYVSKEKLDTLRLAYGLDSVTELLGLSGEKDSYNEKLRNLLISEKIIQRMRLIDDPFNLELSWLEMKDSFRKWLAEVLLNITELTPEEALDYAFGCSNIDNDQSIITMIKRFEHFGTDRVRAITEFSGIQSLESYSEKQLELVESLANTPEETAEKLAAHDVTVLLINRSGDYNGILQDVASKYDQSGQSIFFEINTMADIYKSMAKLKKAGIRPSTMVLAAHSGPGRFMVVDQRGDDMPLELATIASKDYVDKVNSDELPADSKYSSKKEFTINNMKGMARIVDEYMQPSRAIDDNKQDVGRIKFIFEACDVGTETEVIDIDEAQGEVQAGVESVISQLGKDLAKSHIKSRVDIYGAPNGMQSKKTATGIKFSGQPKNVGEKRVDLKAVRISVENQIVSRSSVDEIKLRKVS